MSDEDLPVEDGEQTIEPVEEAPAEAPAERKVTLGPGAKE